MLDGFDVAFADALGLFIRKVLSGDRETDGLYQTIRNAQNWDSFNRLNGQIAAYEVVLAEMHKIQQRMSVDTGDEEARNVRLT